MTETATETAGAAYDWQGFLTRWSEEWADAYDPGKARDAGDEEACRARWLGFAPATPARIAALEERLGHRLPPSYRTFLEVTDGWRHAGGFVWLLAGTEGACWYEDDAGLAEIFQEDLDEDATREEILEATIWTRGLQLAMESDVVDVLMDPDDVDEHGEWAVYTWAPWRASPPERHVSFWEYMQDAYRQFHRLRACAEDRPEFVNATTQELDRCVEEARRDALRGAYEQAEGALAKAQEFGRPRAGALRDQIKWLLGEQYARHFDGLAGDPVYAPELAPVLLADRAKQSWDADSVYAPHPPVGSEEVRTLEHELLRQLREGSYAYTATGPFGDAVNRAREQARWGETDAAWRTLLAALPEWQPLGPDHLAPVGLVADPLLGPLLTPERGRALLATPRGEEATGVVAAAVDEDPEGLAWLAEESQDGGRQAYRFLLVEGVEPAELPALVGAGEDTALRAPMTWWDARQASQPSGVFSSYDDKAVVAVGRAGRGWSFAFDGDPQPFSEERFTSPAVAASRHGRAAVVWAAPDEFDRGALFHLSVAEHGTQRYAFTVLGERCERLGEIPQELAPERLFPQIFPQIRDGGQDRERRGEAAALAAIAAAFGVTLPRFALTHGRLHTFTTRSWTRPPGPGETYAVITIGSSHPGIPVHGVHGEEDSD
ncbi:SMI1/KNR4 family protein [Streptomyces sp. MST-110588]|uniref:SMI1/KNR4 family protein n=1 Tax=Streptomyces sp. MST-110588 TaxID=2833628 RepID=UPI001F5DA5AF|nr:SMI1/KNR4 family protein [Streptomyces sp. MST-110588]UNO38483.1 SMI1/KNR4 family protein [Streptomyces sp. MST-110588]